MGTTDLTKSIALGMALAVAVVAPANPAYADDAPDGSYDEEKDDDRDLSWAIQAWFHFAFAGTADFRVDGQPSIDDEEIDNNLGWGVLGEVRVLKDFLGLGLNYQWIRKQHADDSTGDRWTTWDLGVHARLRVPLFFLSLYARVPVGLSHAVLPTEAVSDNEETRGTGWFAATLFGLELDLLGFLHTFVEIGPTWRHLPFEIDTLAAGNIDFEAWTRDITLNAGLTFTF